MRNARKILPWIPVFGQLWSLGEFVARRIRARRAARRRGRSLPVEQEHVAKGINDAKELYDSTMRAYRRSK